VSARDFLAFYIRDNRVTAVAGMNRDKEMAALEELMRLDRMPFPSQLRNGATLASSPPAKTNQTALSTERMFT
jgi:hypothetical protein